MIIMPVLMYNVVILYFLADSIYNKDIIFSK